MKFFHISVDFRIIFILIGSSWIYWLISWSFKILGTSEFSLRLYSAIFGTLSVPLFYFVFRRLVDHSSAICGAVLLLFSSYHLEHSQFARYYAALFFFAVIAYYYYLLYLKSAELWHLIIASFVTLIGAIFHPTFLLLPTAMWLWALFQVLQRTRGTALVDRKAAMVLLFTGLGTACLVFPYCLSIILNWVKVSNVAGWGYSGPTLILQLLKYYEISIVMAAIAGIVIFYLERNAYFYFFSIVFVSIGLIYFAVAFYIDVRPDYLFCIYPLIFIAAGYFCSTIVNDNRKTINTAIVLALLTSNLLPGFVSHYTGRRSLDPRAAIEYLNTVYENSDKIISFDNGFTFYAGKTYQLAPYIGEVYMPDIGERISEYTGGEQRVWVVLTDNRTGFAAPLTNWLSKHGRLVYELPEKRFDYSFRMLRIYLIS